MGERKAGARLRRRVRDHQWRELRDRGPKAWLAATSYPAVLAAAMGAMALVSLVGGRWPVAAAESAFQRGVILGAAVIGGAWWIREITQALAAGAERDRKGAFGEEYTASALRPLRRHGWHAVHDIEYRGDGNVDHLLVGPGGVLAIDSKYTRHLSPASSMGPLSGEFRQQHGTTVSPVMGVCPEAGQGGGDAAGPAASPSSPAGASPVRVVVREPGS